MTLLRVEPMKDTSQCMNPRFPLSGAKEFPEYISSERKFSDRYTAIAQESRFVNHIVKNKYMSRKYWVSHPSATEKYHLRALLTEGAVVSYQACRYSTQYIGQSTNDSF